MQGTVPILRGLGRLRLSKLGLREVMRRSVVRRLRMSGNGRLQGMFRSAWEDLIGNRWRRDMKGSFN